MIGHFSGGTLSTCSYSRGVWPSSPIMVVSSVDPRLPMALRVTETLKTGRIGTRVQCRKLLTMQVGGATFVYVTHARNFLVAIATFGRQTDFFDRDPETTDKIKMYKLDIRVDMKEAAATERRKMLEQQRKERIFNARQRTIGVPKPNR